MYVLFSLFSFFQFLFCFIYRADSTTAETGSEVARSHGLSSFGLEVVAEMNRLGKQVSQKNISIETRSKSMI
jgi:hypothetical protein